MIWVGWGSKEKLLGVTEPNHCDRCGKRDHWVVYQSKKRIRLYGIPVAQWNKRYIVQCTVCPNGYTVSQSEANELVVHGEQSLRGGFIKAAAAILKIVAEVEGINSAEWDQAKAMLVVLSDGTLTLQTATELLFEASPEEVNANLFDDEQRFILLRIAIEVAVADGSISDYETQALKQIAARLGLDASMVHLFIAMLMSDEATEDNQKIQAACKVLGVDLDASTAEIRAAYKILIMEHHPDRADPENRAEATQRSADINAAYDLLIGREQESPQESHGSTTSTQKDQGSARKKSHTPPRSLLCNACQRKVSATAKFCGFCGTKVAHN